MKGIIFTSFMEFSEQQLGLEFVEGMLDDLQLSSGGAYTNVGTYPTEELLEMVGYVLERHDLDPNALQQAFGEHTFGVLVARYGKLVEQFQDSFDCAALFRRPGTAQSADGRNIDRKGLFARINDVEQSVVDALLKEGQVGASSDEIAQIFRETLHARPRLASIFAT